MSLRRLRSRSRHVVEHPADEGLSLIELVVAMMIFSVVLAVYFGALISMANTTTQARTSVDASDALRATFHALDRQVRYATAINRPVKGGTGAWYVEFEATNLPVGPPNMCYQWRLDPTSNVLSYRTWDESGVTVAAWQGVAWNVAAPGAGSPFVFAMAAGTSLAQKLTVNLQVTGQAGHVLAQQGTTFVARNSSAGSITNGDTNGDGVSDSQVCMTGMDRP